PIREAEHDAAGRVLPSGDRFEAYGNVSVGVGPARGDDHVEGVLRGSLDEDPLATGRARHLLERPASIDDSPPLDAPRLEIEPLDGRNPPLAFTAVSVAAPSDRVAFAMTSFWALAAVRSSPPVIGSTFASLPVVWSTMTSENWPPFAVYTESWRTPCSSSNFAEIGLPSRVLAARPFTSETLAPLTAFASSASPFSPYCWAWG